MYKTFRWFRKKSILLNFSFDKKVKLFFELKTFNLKYKLLHDKTKMSYS